MASMKVRLLTERVEARGIVQRIGEIIEVPKDEALVLLERGHAEPVASKPVERAEKRVIKPQSTRSTKS